MDVEIAGASSRRTTMFFLTAGIVGVVGAAGDQVVGAFAYRGVNVGAVGSDGVNSTLAARTQEAGVEQSAGGHTRTVTGDRGVRYLVLWKRNWTPVTRTNDSRSLNTASHRG
jgi:hypothetical protein